MGLSSLSPGTCAIKHKKRSQSMDVLVPVQNKIYSNILPTSFYTEKVFSTRVPIKVYDNLSLPKNCEKNCSSYDRPTRRKSFNSSLYSIDEVESLDFHRTRKRELCESNICSEKCRSDLLIRCAYTNKGFEVNNQKNVSFYDDILDTLPNLPDQNVKIPKKNSLSFSSPPKIKVRISDEWGNRVDDSLDSQSDSFDVDDFWNFGTNEIRNGHQCDAFNVIENKEITRPTVNKCTKCGHKSLKSQFSTSFS